jgi:hypothetical protein
MDLSRPAVIGIQHPEIKPYCVSEIAKELGNSSLSFLLHLLELIKVLMLLNQILEVTDCQLYVMIWHSIFKSFVIKKFLNRQI